MHRYKDAFAMSAIIIAILSILPFLGALFEWDLMQILYFGVFPGLWLFANSSLRRSRKGSFAFSWLLAMLACCGSLLQLLELRTSVIMNAGFEGVDGHGSPLAFMISLGFYLVASVGFGTLVWFGYTALREARSTVEPAE